MAKVRQAFRLPNGRWVHVRVLEREDLEGLEHLMPMEWADTASRWRRAFTRPGNRVPRHRRAAFLLRFADST